ncbi:unnamed protein product [Closterium sp. NIES-53]
MAVFAVRHAAAAGENARLLKKSRFGKARRATCTAAPPEAALFALRLAVLLLVLSSASRFPTSAAAAPAAAAAAVPVLTVPMNVSAGEGLLHSESLLCCILGCGPTLSLVLALPLLPFSGHTLMPVRPPSPPLPSPPLPLPHLPSPPLPCPPSSSPSFPLLPHGSKFPLPSLPFPLSPSAPPSLFSLPPSTSPLPLPPVPVLLQLQNTLELVQYNWAGAGDCAIAAERGEAESGEETAGEPGGATGAAAAVGGAAEPLFPLRGKAAAGGVGRAGWAGVSCDVRGNPVRMEFPQQGLTGHLPLDVIKLTSLTKIDLQKNLIIERLDVFIKPLEGLTNLQHLDLSSNFLFGSIQPSITAAFPRLTALLLSSNRLTGRVPSRLPPLLSTLSLSSNYLSGSLPRTSLLCSPASFSLNCFSEQDLFSCFASRTSQPGSAGPRLGSAVPDLASLASKAGVLSFHVPLAEAVVVQCLCEGEATTCDATSAANPVISPASVACVSEEVEAEAERAVAALRAIAEARITVVRGMIPPGAGARLPAAAARPPVVAGAPPLPAAGALPRTGAVEADLPRASAARLLGPRAVTSKCSRASELFIRLVLPSTAATVTPSPLPSGPPPSFFPLLSIPYCPFLPRPSPPPIHSPSSPPPLPLLPLPRLSPFRLVSHLQLPCANRLVPHPSTLPCTLHIYLPPGFYCDCLSLSLLARLTPSDDAPLRVPQAEPLSSPPPEPQPQLGNWRTIGRASVMETGILAMDSAFSFSAASAACYLLSASCTLRSARLCPLLVLLSARHCSSLHSARHGLLLSLPVTELASSLLSALHSTALHSPPCPPFPRSVLPYLSNLLTCF